MRTKFLVTANLGHVSVNVYVIPTELGGYFDLRPVNVGLPFMEIGIAYRFWEDCASTLLHEAMEQALTHLDKRYAHSGKLNGDSGDFIFVFDHAYFGRACSMVAPFMVQVLPLLRKAWVKNRLKPLKDRKTKQKPKKGKTKKCANSVKN